MFAPLVAAMLMTQGLDDTGTAIAQPVGTAILEPISGSYFQVFEFFGREPYTWRHAARMVKGYRHDGREGRLAVIKEGSTHYFLILNFENLRDQPMWIGLSAECNKQADLIWIDDTLLADTSFRAWSPVAQKKVRDKCIQFKDSGTQLPIYYEPSQLGVRWEVADTNTNLKRMMVEFPVPDKEVPESENSEAEPTGQ